MRRASVTSFFHASSPSPKRPAPDTPHLATRVSVAPLAERLRPRTLDDVVGQADALGPGTVLRAAVDSGHLPSLILWGPPGCGKTSVGRVLAASAGCTFVCMSAAAGGGVAEVKRTIEDARTRQRFAAVSSSGEQQQQARTVLFLDEIHRFNKSQQDSLLRAVEDGTVTLIGATTENPSFEVNSALLSRCRVVVMQRLAQHDLETLVRRACAHENAAVDDDAVRLIAQLADGDARRALNAVEMLLCAAPVVDEHDGNETAATAPAEDKDKEKEEESKDTGSSVFEKQWQQEEEEDRRYLAQDAGGTGGPGGADADGSVIVVEDSENEGAPTAAAPPPSPPPPPLPPRRHIKIDGVREVFANRAVVYDKNAEEHYNVISALHKSVRGSDVDASLYWLYRMILGGEDPLYIARRLVRMASEDIGMADPHALPLAVAAYQACHFLGYPECDVHLAQAVVYLAQAPKSNHLDAVAQTLRDVIQRTGSLPVPMHIRNAPTRLMADLGYGAGYKYTPDWVAAGLDPSQTYLPDALLGAHFWKGPGSSSSAAPPHAPPSPPPSAADTGASKTVVVVKPSPPSPTKQP